MTAGWDYDRDALAIAVALKAQALGLSGRAAADAARVSHSTFWRAEDGQTLSAAHVLRLAQWAGFDARDLLLAPASPAPAAKAPALDAMVAEASTQIGPDGVFHGEHPVKQQGEQGVVR